MDLNRIPPTHGHDFNSGQSRVVMVRKTEQRTFQMPRGGEEKPKFERVTHETVQTFNGQRVQKTTTRRVLTDAERGSQAPQALVIETREEVIGGPISNQGGRPGSGPNFGNRPVFGQTMRHSGPGTSSASDRAGPSSRRSTGGLRDQTDRVNERGGVSPRRSKEQMSKTPSQTSRGRMSAADKARGTEPTVQKSGSQTGSQSAGSRPISMKEVAKELPSAPKTKETVTPRTKKSPARPNEYVGVFEKFADECLQAHNKYRAKHDVPPLKLNKKLCQFSEEWAKRLASTGQMQHRPNIEYGENLFCVWSSDPNHKVTGNEPVDNWYAEIKDFTFGQEPRDLRAGHFTQVIWRDSNQLGVAYAKSRNGQTFVVCNYDPPGNFIGNFAAQVPPVGGDGTGKQKQLQRKQSEPPKTAEDGKDEEPSQLSFQMPASGEVTPVIQPVQPYKYGPRPVVPLHIREGDLVLQNESLNLHNELRARHGVPPVYNDKDLSRICKEWADTLIRENKFGHRPNNKYGENIFCHWTNDVAAADLVGAKEAINAWYSEIKDFRFGEEPRVLKSGHFTQVIWKNTERIGIGRARDGKGRVIIVANYDPRGNYIGQFTNNCPPLIKN